MRRKKQKEHMSPFINMGLFYIGVAGKRINWDKVLEVYDTDEVEQLQHEIKTFQEVETV